MLTVWDQWWWLLGPMMFSFKPQFFPSPALSLRTPKIPPSRWGEWGVLLPHWAQFIGPILVLTLMRCSCFQIQPLILILFLFLPLGRASFEPGVPSRTPQTWCGLYFSLYLVVPALLRTWAEPLGHERPFLDTGSNRWGDSQSVFHAAFGAVEQMLSWASSLINTEEIR